MILQTNISSQYVFDYQKRILFPAQYTLSRDNKVRVSLPEVVGKGYGKYWRWKGRYRVCKGSRASKKSKTTALGYIVNMTAYPDANLLVVRKTFRTLKDSCFTELKWAINRLGVTEFWDIKESPLEMTYRPTGQKIFFRGLDDPLKVTSITVEHGYLCWMWIEEAYEIGNESDFDMLDESIRGAIPEETGLFKQITLTFNPWNEHHWIKKRFFDTPRNDTLAMTTNYMCNEWLDAADLQVFETMKANNPRRYRVAGLGDWGIVDGLIYENWEEKAFDIDEIRSLASVKSAFGLDFGYTNDPSALFCGLIDQQNKTLWVFDEMYQCGMSNEAIAKKVISMGYGKEKIVADCAEPKSISRLRDLELTRIRAARKGKDSINNGIDFIQDYHIIIHPKCVNFLTEIGNYTWDTDTKTGKRLNAPVDDFNHLMDAMRYGLEECSRPNVFSF
jgi:phage terminase large subunit